jgi:hypothetical protein
MMYSGIAWPTREWESQENRKENLSASYTLTSKSLPKNI